MPTTRLYFIHVHSTPHFPFFPTSLSTLQAIASQHIPGSLTQRAMAAQFAFNKQLNRNKKDAKQSIPLEGEG